MITSSMGSKLRLSIIINWLATYHYTWVIHDRLNFPYQHKGLEIAIILTKAGYKISHPIRTLFTGNLRYQHICVFNVALFGRKLTRREHREFPAFLDRKSVV